MKNSPTVSLRDVSTVIGSEELRHLGATPPAFTFTCTYISTCDEMHEHPAETRVPGRFLGFRNGFANALLKPFRNFWTKFIPETGTS